MINNIKNPTKLITIEFQLNQLRNSYIRDKNKKQIIDIVNENAYSIVTLVCILFISVILYIKYKDKQNKKKMYSNNIEQTKKENTQNDLPFYISTSNLKRYKSRSF